MIVRTKPLKFKLKETRNPLEDFMFLSKIDHSAVTKEVIFLRYIGIPDTVQHYIENILKIDRCFSSSVPAVPYLRLQRLEGISNKNEISRLTKVWEEWDAITNVAVMNPHLLHQTPLCSQLNNDSLEWTKKLIFVEILSKYRTLHPQSNDTQIKNFAVKFLNWIEIYLPKLFEGTSISPKVVFIGDIKLHELLFLYFLSRLGCDICYMNPKEDMVHLYPEIEKFSTLYKFSTLNSDQITIPDLTAPSSISAKENLKQIPTKSREFSYEELAGLSNSVVMIKSFDEHNKILCSGSGVVIHSKGYILTNLHVVAGGHLFSVLYENETEEYLTGNFIKYHQQYDLAIIKVDKNCAPLPVKTDGNLVRGQKIVAIGSPLGLFNSVSDGIVSGFREIKDIPMIQFTAPISDGSSGGALLDMYGRLVGLITAGFDKGQNLNLAVPAENIYHFGRNFIEHTD
ncbi:trypsin-like peptidase domain-containing protein [Bacillus sp. JJ1532]|uniref:trypsin-like peptidase domain-containing protein n=1 Tax=unclassified Bacillus (in: firmicutes) TaxID=185979 RepID=UPI002FFF1214